MLKTVEKKQLKYHYWHFILIETIKKNKSQYYFNSTIYMVLFYQQHI